MGGWRWARACLGPALSVASIAWGQSPTVELPPVDVPVPAAPFAVIRLLLRPGTGYDERREEFLPFDRIVDPNPDLRQEVLSLIHAAGERPVFVLVNNKAEGCAPRTIRALAEELTTWRRRQAP